MKWKIPFAGTDIYWSAEPQGMLIDLSNQFGRESVKPNFRNLSPTIFQKISLIVKKKSEKFWTKKKSGHIQVKMTICQVKIPNGRIDSSRLRMLDTFCGEIQNEIKNGKFVIPKVSVTQQLHPISSVYWTKFSNNGRN